MSWLEAFHNFLLTKEGWTAAFVFAVSMFGACCACAMVDLHMDLHKKPRGKLCLFILGD